MARRRLSDSERRHIAAFEDHTGITPTDCVIDETYDRVIFVVPPDEMAAAIGPDGSTVRQVEAAINTDIKLVADGTTAAELVANALAPAAVYDVTLEETDEGTVAYVEVDSRDVGVAIGTDGRNIDAARRLAARHFDIDDVQVV